MRHLKKFLKLKVVFGIGIFFILCQNTFSIWVVNSLPIIYNGTDDPKNSLSSMYAMDNYVIDGAGYFLEAYSKTLLLMKKIEWGNKEGLNTDELKRLLDDALKNMESARESYVNLIRMAETTPYNLAIIEKLKSFDYDAFQKTHGLNPGVFATVKKYLGNGDIRKLCYELFSDIEGIIRLLNQVKGQFDAGNYTPVKEIWTLNDTFSTVLLFGQYVSQVLYSIQGI